MSKYLFACKPLILFLFICLTCFSCARRDGSNYEVQDAEINSAGHTIEYYDSVALKQLDDNLHNDKLDYLNFGFYSKEVVPERVFSKIDIKRLTIFHTNLRKLPKSICRLTSIKDLNLSHNRLSDIDEITCLINLEFLFLDQNRLEILPDTFSNLSKLYHLDISQNKFNSKDINKLPMNLVELHIANSNFSEVPKAVFDLKQLEFLNLSNNNLSELPTELVELKNLKRILIYGNPINVSQLNEFRKVMTWCDIEF
ncbi:MAG: leucine-rich repeat domain-containing protein [Chryseobacterium taeanense]|jgi:Leucine-rich repeat (LRR) protein